MKPPENVTYVNIITAKRFLWQLKQNTKQQYANKLQKYNKIVCNPL